MSGPKVDAATLAREKQLELERQARLQEQLIRQAAERLVAAQDSMRQARRRIDDNCSQTLVQAAGEPALAPVLERLRAVRDRYLTQADQYLYASVPDGADQIDALAARTSAAAAALASDYRQAAASLEAKVQAHLQDTARAGEFARRQSRAVAAAERAVHVRDIDLTDLIDRVKAQPDLEQQARQQAADMFRRIESVVNSDCVTEKRKDGLYRLAEGLYQALSSGDASVRAALIQCRQALGQAELEAQTFERQYQAYYRQYVLHFNRLQGTRQFVVPKERYRFASLEALREETDRLAETSSAARERDYIRAQLDQVMRRFGYSTTSELVLRPDQTGVHYLSRKDGGDAAIHTYLSEDSDSIMMETVSVAAAEPGEQDRIVGADELSGEEKQRLLEQQTQFCRMHPQILEALAERGVILSALSRQPADEQFCRKIAAGREQAAQIQDESLYYQRSQTPAAALYRPQAMAMSLD